MPPARDRHGASPAPARAPASGPGRSGAAGARAARRSPRRAGQLEGPHRVGGVDVQRPVAGEPRGPCVARDRVADRRRPALDELGETGLGPKRASSRAERVSQPVQGSPPRPGSARAAARRGVGRRDHGLLEPGDARCEHAPAAGVELREDVVEEQQRRRAAAAPPRRAGARAARAAARPASRSCRRSRIAAAIRMSSRCGPSPVAPRAMSASSRASSAATVGGVAVVGEPRGQAELAGRACEPRRQRGHASRARRDERARRAGRCAPSTARARPRSESPS